MLTDSIKVTSKDMLQQLPVVLLLTQCFTLSCCSCYLSTGGISAAMLKQATFLIAHKKSYMIQLDLDFKGDLVLSATVKVDCNEVQPVVACVKTDGKLSAPEEIAHQAVSF